MQNKIKKKWKKQPYELNYKVGEIDWMKKKKNQEDKLPIN